MSVLSKKMPYSRKAFTLVELLVVIVIIGVLAGILAMSVGSASDRAEATRIVNDMRVLKAAVFMDYADTGKWVNGEPISKNVTPIYNDPPYDRYLNKLEKYTDSKMNRKYAFIQNRVLFAERDGRLYLGYYASPGWGAGGWKSQMTRGVFNELKKMSRQAGLHHDMTTGDNPWGYLDTLTPPTKNTAIWMVVR